MCHVVLKVPPWSGSVTSKIPCGETVALNPWYGEPVELSSGMALWKEVRSLGHASCSSLMRMSPRGSDICTLGHQWVVLSVEV